jgi:nucleoside-diphosphate-sugar epimerase
MGMKEKILVTGAFGQIGTDLVLALQKKYGKENIIALDLKIPEKFDGISVQMDIMDKEKLKDVIDRFNIKTVYHLVALLSASGEKNPQFTWDLNMNSLRYVLDYAIKYNLKVFWPSSIAAFGPTTPRFSTPQHTIMEPSTMYGMTKLAGEMLISYYKNNLGVDVRSIRYPGLISWKAEPGGGTTDYAVAIFYEGLKTGEYTCFVREDTMLPMMYMDDAISATIKLMEADKNKLTVPSYNLAAISFTVGELAKEINKHIKLKVNYIPDHRQKIADSWPASIDDSLARKDWGWKHEYTLSKMTEVMLKKLGDKLGEK